MKTNLKQIMVALCAITVSILTACGPSAAERKAQAEAEQARIDSIAQAKADSIAQIRAEELARQKAEEEARRQREEKERQQKEIVGTYTITIHKTSYDKIATYYDPKKGFTYESKPVGTIDGIEYLVVYPDMRVSLLQPMNHKVYIGKVTDIVDGTFIINTATKESKIGDGAILYKDGRNIGSSGSYGYPRNIIIDTNTRRIYDNVEKWRGRDIGETEHLMYDKKDPSIRETNDTKWERNYYDQYKSKYQNRGY